MFSFWKHHTSYVKYSYHCQKWLVCAAVDVAGLSVTNHFCFHYKVIIVPEAFQKLEATDMIPRTPEPSAPLVTMGKREDVYDEPPRKKTYRSVPRPSGKKDPVCGICLSGPEKNKKSKLRRVKRWFFSLVR